MELFTSFEGRINRAKWWIGAIALAVIQMAVQGIIMSMVNQNDALIPLIILILVFLYPFMAVYAKRWHDREKSGWWSLIILVPVVGGIWILVELGILKGTDGPNKYGPDPLA